MIAKRLVDLFLAVSCLILLSPLLVAIVVAVFIMSGRPVFYVAERIGRRGEVFRLYKYRSMAPDKGETGPAITSSGDPRVTGIGRILRRSKLDELPQLWNVVKGDMSLVGPRPEDPRYVALYTAKQREILEARPGVTSLASLHYRHEEQLLEGPGSEQAYISEIMPAKLSIEAEYLQKRSLLSDLGVLAKTAGYLLRVVAHADNDTAPGPGR